MNNVRTSCGHIKLNYVIDSIKTMKLKESVFHSFLAKTQPKFCCIHIQNEFKAKLIALLLLC